MSLMSHQWYKYTLINSRTCLRCSMAGGHLSHTLWGSHFPLLLSTAGIKYPDRLCGTNRCLPQIWHRLACNLRTLSLEKKPHDPRHQSSQLWHYTNTQCLTPAQAFLCFSCMRSWMRSQPSEQALTLPEPQASGVSSLKGAKHQKNRRSQCE